jgi:sugar transferase (PEP-CTERM/EpsH1 system associated)
VRKKVAVILSRFPYPLDKGDKLRAYHQLKYLCLHYDIYLYCIHTEDVSKESFQIIQSFCKEIKLFKIQYFDIFKGICYSLWHRYPIQVGYFYAKQIHQKINLEITNHEIDTVYCQLSRTALYAKDFKGRKVIDFQDAFSTNYKRLSEHTKGIYRLFYTREYKTMLTFEQKMIHWFDACTIIADFDKSQIEGSEHKMTVIPNGVDTGYYSAKKQIKKYDLLFVGNLSYLPNSHAVLYLVQKIVPLLLAKFPTVQVNIAGADTPKDFLKLGNKNITISGFVPDIRDVYASAKIFVAPLFTGAGLQNKILEAMSMQLPCVTTSLVNFSLKASENKHLMIANDEQAFADQIISLLQNEALQTQLSTQAHQFVEQQYSWNAANEKLAQLL